MKVGVRIANEVGCAHMENLKLFLPLLLSGFVVLITVSFVLGVFLGGPFIPTHERKVGKMLKLAKLKKGEKVVDLGAGDGRFVIAAAKLGFEAVGVEINPFQVWWCRFRIRLAGLSGRAKILRGNIFTYDLRDADVVVCYLFPETNKKLQPKLKRELKKGARVLTNTFSFHGWTPSAQDKKEKLFVYTMGKR